MPFNTVNILGFDISSQGLISDALEAFRFIGASAETKYMACANPHSLVVTNSDDLFKESLQNADILLPDGAGIIFASKVLNIDVKERVAGAEFFVEFSKLCNHENNIKIFFLGSTDYVLNRLVSRFKKEFPNVTVCGAYSPPYKDAFSEEDNQQIISVINIAQPHVLWVGMTAPKQEKWIYQNKDKLNVKFIGAIGAVFDFYSGTKKRAPEWVCNIGLEWLPRLIREPVRLWKRNFVSSPLFLLAVFKQKFGF